MKDADHCTFGFCPVGIKFSQDQLEKFEVGPPILHWFVLVLRVALYLAPDTIHKSFGVSEIYSKEVFKLKLGYRFGFIVLSFILELLSKGFFAQK